VSSATARDRQVLPATITNDDVASATTVPWSSTILAPAVAKR
jgi:hypothetical protein